MRNRIKLFLPLVSAAIVCGGVAPMISCNKSDPKPTPDPTKPTEIKLTYDSGKTEDIEITYDKTLTFKCVVYPSTAEQNFVLVSSNRNVADFNGNVLKPNPENLGGGDTNIYAKSVKYPGVVSNVIKVTVERRQSSLNIDYSKVDFNQKMTIGTDTSTYKFTDFNADFIFDDTYIVGNHTINAYAEWVEKPGVGELTVSIIDPTRSADHTKFNIKVSCPFTDWEVDKEYKYSLYFIIDKDLGDEGSKRIDVDKELSFVNHGIKPEIIEPTTTILTPTDHGATITIEGCSANFQIGQQYKNTLKVEKIYFKSGNIEYIDISITNVKNTSAGSTFNVEIHTNGIDLSEDIVFYFNYLLNGVVAKQSQEYTIESDRYIKCNQDDKIITLNDTDPLSVKIDGFKANFAFNNIQGSAYPIVTATCKPLYGSYADANVTIGDIDMHEDYTTFSLFIVFAPTAATWTAEPFIITFNADQSQLFSDNLVYYFATPSPIQYCGDYEPKPILNGEYFDGKEIQEGCFTNIGTFTAPVNVHTTGLTAKFEWNSKNSLPTPKATIINDVQSEASLHNDFYITFVWPNSFEPDKATFKVTILEGDESVLVLNGFSLTKSDPDIYWDIESNFVGSTGQCHVTKDAKDEIDITLTGVDENKELWGIDFACGGVEVPIRGLVSVDDATNTIVITPHYIYCQIIPGLKLNLTFTYVNPSDVIHINQQTEMKTPGGDKKALQTNDIEWIAKKTYYLSADFNDSAFDFNTDTEFFGAFIGFDPDSFTWKPCHNAKAYSNKVVTETQTETTDANGGIGISIDNYPELFKTTVVNFTIQVVENLGTHKFTLFHLS